MIGRIVLFSVILPCFLAVQACFITDELGIIPANAVREDEVGRRVQKSAALGWWAGVEAFTHARGLPGIANYEFWVPAYTVPLSAKPLNLARETVYYTGPSVKLCLFSARSYAYSGAFLTLDRLDLEGRINRIRSAPTKAQGEELESELDFAILMSSVMAYTTADIGCREELVRTGRLFEGDRGRL